MDGYEILKLVLSGGVCGGVTLLFMRLFYTQLGKTQDAKIEQLKTKLDSIDDRIAALEDTGRHQVGEWQNRVSHPACSEFRELEKTINAKQFEHLSKQLERVEGKLDQMLMDKAKQKAV